MLREDDAYHNQCEMRSSGILCRNYWWFPTDVSG